MSIYKTNCHSSGTRQLERATVETERQSNQVTARTDQETGNPRWSSRTAAGRQIDIQEVAARALGSVDAVLARWLPDGKRKGREYLARNPTRHDAHPGSFSINVASGQWADFASGDKGGDLVSLVAYLEGVNQPLAAEILVETMGLNGTRRGRRGIRLNGKLNAPPKRAKPTWQALLPIPDDSPPPPEHPKLGKPSATWTYRDADGRPLFHVLRFETANGKELRPLTYCEADGTRAWQWQALPEPRPLYGLDRLAAKPDAPAIVCEGEKAADAAAELLPNHAAISPMNGAKSPGKADWSPLQGREVFIWPDADEPGLAFAADVVKQVSATILDPAKLREHPPKGWDAADALAEGIDTERLRQWLATGQEQPDDDAEIQRLAELSPMEYERKREAAAARLGVRASVLDAEVKQRRPKPEKDAKGSAVELYEPEAWAEPVNGAQLLDEIKAAILRHMVMGDAQAAAVALWIVHSQSFELVPYTPRLLITAPERECGKTLLMWDLIGPMTRRPMEVEIMKVAPFFRLAEEHQPTYLIDEVDTFVKEDSDLISALNSGITPKGRVPRCMGDDNEVRLFRTWCPVAMAGIKLGDKLPGSTVSRCIVVLLDRATPGQLVEEDIFHEATHGPALRRLGQKVRRWCDDNAEAICRHRPALPAGVHNRQADKWRPLFTIAELAGDHWPAVAKRALEAQEDISEPTRAQELLADTHRVMDGKARDIATEDLIKKLCEIEESPWRDYNFRARDEDARRIQPKQLAGLLKGYVKPKQVRPPEHGGKQKRGYEEAALARAWASYLGVTPPISRHTVTKPATARATAESAPVTVSEAVTGKNRRKPSNGAVCDTVTGKSAPTSDEGSRHTYKEVI